MNPLSNHNFAAVLPGDSVAGLVVANGISSFLNIYNTLLIVRLVLTWFPNSPPAIVSPLRYNYETILIRETYIYDVLIDQLHVQFDSFLMRVLCDFMLYWFSTLCDPYLNIFRGIIPPLGGTLDLSPILAFLVLNVFTSTAAALPCELPVTGSASQQSPPSAQAFIHLTTSQRKWMKRLSGNQGRSSDGVN